MPTEAFRRKELQCLLVFQIIFAEMVGTGILMYVGCHMQAAYGMWTFAMCTLLAIHIFGPISGGHINPGATIVALIMDVLPQKKLAIVYWVAQIVGGLIGYAIHYEVTLMDLKADQKGACLTKPYSSGTTAQTFGLELIMSFIFFMATAARFDTKNKSYKDTEAFTMGFILFGMYYTLADITPLSMNTARSLPPALFAGDYEGHWVYWVAPNIAAALAAVVYRFGFSKRIDLDSVGN